MSVRTWSAIRNTELLRISDKVTHFGARRVRLIVIQRLSKTLEESRAELRVILRESLGLKQIDHDMTVQAKFDGVEIRFGHGTVIWENPIRVDHVLVRF